MTLVYPASSTPALGFLKKSRNTIDVFVEDPSKVDVWLALVKANCPKGEVVTSVNALGDRDSVVEACKINATSSRRQIFIIDGDMDFVLGKGIPRLPKLYRIPATNLEAVLLRARGCVKALTSMCPSKTHAALKADLDSYLEQVWGRALVPLYGLFAEHQRLGGGVRTSGVHVSQFSLTNSNPWMPDRFKINDKMIEVYAECERVRRRRKKDLRNILGRVRTLKIEQILSGKTILWPLYVAFFGRTTGVHIRPDALMLLVLSHSRGELPCLRRRLSRC